MDRQEIDRILDALKDGKKHTLEDIRQRAGTKDTKAILILTFLGKFEFVEMDKERNVKLKPLIKRFLDRLDRTGSTSFYEEITA